MIPFLKNVADVYYKKHGSEVSNFTFVFPTRRAGIFFQKYLAEAARQPLFSPEILTVPDLFCKLSPYKTIDHVELLFMLYDLYKRISNSQESFDEFMFWGEMVLSDFNDVDKFMVEAEQLFQNIYDLREIEDGFSYFTEEQISAIRRFWTNFIPPDGRESKKEFRELWEVLSELYGLLKQELEKTGFAYEGMLFREVVERCKRDAGLLLPFSRLVVIGLNGLSKTEEELFKYLHRQGIADFYWDYSSSLVKDSDNKASYFIDRNRLQFPSQYSLEPEAMSLEVPSLEVIGVPSAVGQAKYVHEILNSFVQQGIIRNRKDALNTAVVLPDENLLLPVLYSIPEQIDSINVTMGYSLSNSSIAGLMEHVFNVQRNLRTYNGQNGFYFRFVLSILSHRYIYNITGEDCIKLRQNILQYNKVIVPVSDFEGQGIIELIFTPLNHWKEIAGYLKSILAQLQYSLLKKKQEQEETQDIRSVDMEREFVIEYYKTINKLEKALENVQAEMSVDTYFRLLKKLVTSINVPFSGEPLSGLQVMGVLETRALDFDNIILLSMNEGIFPEKRATNSFIPYILRRGFGLPTYEHQDSILAYHFYRLINRAKRIYMLYDSRTEGLQTGEVSRYYHQLKYLYPNMFDIREKVAVYEVSTNESLSVSICKDNKVKNKLNKFLDGTASLSASSINTYLDCPLQFYFSVVEGMEEEDELAETIQADVFGSIFHSVMEWLYRPFEGKLVTADLLHNIRKNENLLTETIELSFARNYFKTETPHKLTGQNYLTGEVIRRYVKKVLQTDAKYTPFTYLESEKRLNVPYTLPSGRTVYLKGFIDRVDEVNGHIRIIDYKTGKGVLQYKSMEEVFDKDIKDRPKAVMQVFLYAYLCQHEYVGKKLEPGIYYLRNLFDDKFDPDVCYRPSYGETFRVEDFSGYAEDFRQHFDACLEEIFDEQYQFSQSTNGKACEWCRFTVICRK